jgi:hypothetical protein
MSLPHKVAWVSAAPLWAGSLKTPEVLRRPAILGFGSDTFMDDLLADLARKPDAIAARVATGKSLSYRERQPGEAYGFQPTTEALKLYQPAHGWFYLVTGSLVCQLPGLPDHGVDLSAGDKAGFVLRRLGDGGRELALVVGSDGKKSWQPASGAALVDGEELLPLFPLGFQEGDRRRRMMAGVIPAASQDALQAAPVAGVSPPVDPSGKPGPADAFEEVKGRVTNGINVLVSGPVPADATLQPETSRFILMDLADFLQQYIPVAWNAIQNGSTPLGKAGALVTFLRGLTVSGRSVASLVKDILSFSLDTAYPYNLAGLDVSPDLATTIATFEARLQDALEEATGTSIANVPIEVQSVGATKYVVRLVYQKPRCGPLQADVVSAPSEPFLLAPYFDVDAPSRPIRIAMPFDPSIKGLRQFKKNVKLVLSDALRKKVAGIGKINDSIQGPGFDCGGFSFSIPIITICAMIILFVFIFLLNIVFWWLPFVKICFPKIEVDL